MNTDVYDTYRNDKIIGAKTLKKKFKDDRKKAIYYVKEQTGWDIEVYIIFMIMILYLKRKNIFCWI